MTLEMPYSITYVYRHIQVAAMMRKDKPNIKHRFDPWHLAKSARKNLVAASKKKEWADLVPWISSIVNHLWWSAAMGSTSLPREVEINCVPCGRHPRVAWL